MVFNYATLEVAQKKMGLTDKQDTFSAAHCAQKPKKIQMAFEVVFGYL